MGTSWLKEPEKRAVTELSLDRRRASSSETAAAKYQRSEVMSLPAVPEGAVTCCPARASRSAGVMVRMD
jgi:hypothetical protein